MIFFTLVSPNYRVAQSLSMAYSSLALIFSGVGIEFSSMDPRFRALRYLSWSKYTLAALVFHLFKGKSITTPWGSVDEMLMVLQLGSPSTVRDNVLACVGFYLFFTMGGILSLKYLVKEKR